MKYCNHCQHLSAGEPLFCPFCNHTFDVKLCPHRHVNERSAQFCQECGSADLSTPAPERSLVSKTLILILPKLGALLLLLFSLYVFFGILEAILRSQQLSGQLVCVVFVLALAWYLYLKVADSFAGKAVRHLMGKGSKRHGQAQGRGHGH